MKQTYRRTDRQTDRQTDRHRQTDRQTDTDRQIDRQTDRHRQTDRQTDRQRGLWTDHDDDVSPCLSMYRCLADSIKAVLRSDKLSCRSDDVLQNADVLLLAA